MKVEDIGSKFNPNLHVQGFRWRGLDLGYRIRLVKRPELLSPAHFLRYILRTEMQVEVARRILARIGGEGWDCRGWKRLCSEEGIKQGCIPR